MRFYLRSDLKPNGVPFSNKHLLDLERAGKFPRRIYLSYRTAAWPADEIDAWLAVKIAARDGKQRVA